MCNDNSNWPDWPFQSGPDCGYQQVMDAVNDSEPVVMSIKNKSFQPGHPGKDKFTIYFNKELNYRLDIMDLTGRNIAHINGTGIQCEWDGKDDNAQIVKSGIYVYILNYGGERKKGVCILSIPRKNIK